MERSMLVPIRSRILTFSSATIILGCAGTPWVNESPSDNLTSFALLSDAIALVERIDEPSGQTVTREIRYRVKKVYKGAIRPGREFKLPGLTKYIYREPLQDLPFGEPLDCGPEALAFLAARREGRGRLTDSHDFVRAICLAAPNGSLAELEEDLESAILRVKRYDEFRARQDSKERTQALLTLLGPPQTLCVFAWDPEATRWHDDDSGAFTEAVLKEVAPWGQVRPYLDAFSRGHGVNYREFPPTELLDAARDTSLPVQHRATALWLMNPFPFRPHVEVDLSVVPFLADPEPELRRAAVDHLGKVLEWAERSPASASKELIAPIVEALWTAWQSESDPLARTLLHVAANQDLVERVSGRSGQKRILFEGCLHDSMVHFVSVFVDRRYYLGEAAFVHATPADGGPPRRTLLRSGQVAPFLADGRPNAVAADCFAECAHRSITMVTSHKETENGWFEFKPPLPAGKYRMWVEKHFRGRLESDDALARRSDPLIFTTTPMEVEIER